MKIVAPSKRLEENIRFANGRSQSPDRFKAFNQLPGRYDIGVLPSTRPELKGRFAKLGDVFWFDQHRNQGAVAARQRAEDDGHREQLPGDSHKGEDYVILLQETLSTVFPGTKCMLGVFSHQLLPENRRFAWTEGGDA